MSAIRIVWLARDSLAQNVQRRLDHRLGVGAGHERVIGEAQIEAPEFLPAKDARDRLVRDPALCVGRDHCRFVTGDLARSLGGQAGVIEIERRAEQQPRIKVGRFDAVVLEMGRQRATGGLDRQSCERDVRAHAALPCAANCAA